MPVKRVWGLCISPLQITWRHEVISRRKLTKNFSIMNNLVLERQDLSLKAKGLWAFLMTKPDGWQTSLRGLVIQVSDGETSIRSALKELERVGLYQKLRRNKPDGTFVWEDFVFDEPCVENPRMDSPRVENSTQVNTNIVNTEQVNTNFNTNVLKGDESPKTPGKQEINQLFEDWHELMGIPISSRIQANRYAANNLLKRYGYAKVRDLVRGCSAAQQDKYAPRIADFVGLQAKLNDLLLWGRRRQQDTGNLAVID